DRRAHALAKEDPIALRAGGRHRERRVATRETVGEEALQQRAVLREASCRDDDRAGADLLTARLNARDATVSQHEILDAVVERDLDVARPARALEHGYDLGAVPNRFVAPRHVLGTRERELL